MRICSIGECMIELSNIEKNIFKQSFAGDTANSAIYLSRLGATSSYISSVGKDDLSKKMLKYLKKEKVQTHNIYENKNRGLGLYVIKNNNKGERSFFYWRSNAAAKTLFENVDFKILFNQISKYDAIYFSGITLSIYDKKNTNRFYQFLKLLKNEGVKICFDFNVRLKNWENKKNAQDSIFKFSSISDIIFITKEDLKNLGLRNHKNIIKKNYGKIIVVFRLGNGELEIYNKSKLLYNKYFIINKNINYLEKIFKEFKIKNVT